MRETGTLLVVDDDGVSRAVLTNMLEAQGHTVLVARNGPEGLEMVRRHRVDLVMLDIMMPAMDGYQVVSAMKADEALRDIPVVMISAVDDVAGIVKAVKLGAEDFIFKPFEEVLLRARVEGCLERRRLRQRAQNLSS